MFLSDKSLPTCLPLLGLLIMNFQTFSVKQSWKCSYPIQQIKHRHLQKLLIALLISFTLVKNAYVCLGGVHTCMEGFFFKGGIKSCIKNFRLKTCWEVVFVVLTAVDVKGYWSVGDLGFSCCGWFPAALDTISQVSCRVSADVHRQGSYPGEDAWEWASVWKSHVLYWFPCRRSLAPCLLTTERKFGKTEAGSCDCFLHIVPAICSHTEKFWLMRGAKGLWRAVGQPAPGPAGFWAHSAVVISYWGQSTLFTEGTCPRGVRKIDRPSFPDYLVFLELRERWKIVRKILVSVNQRTWFSRKQNWKMYT